METSGRLRWLWAVLLMGAVYLVVGLVFATLAGWSGSNQMQVVWRLSAWVISAVAFAAHIGYEHVRLRSPPRTTAFHASLSVALGAFGLAVAANLHARAAANPQHTHSLASALVLWPVVLGLPAFIVALAAAAGLALRRRT
jgi:vacuolar-type H+-ATPase subunit I/STV1